MSEAHDTRLHNLLVALAIGAAGGAVFVFAFPRGAITTLMHEVLDLPGPGAGIALVLGPLVVLSAQTAEFVCKRHGTSLLAALGFALVAVTARTLGVEGESKGMFGSLPFAGALLSMGLLLELGFLVRGRLTSLVFTLTFAAAAGVGLLAYYWILIFPLTSAGWVSWRNVPLLAALAFAGGLGAGIAAHVAWHGVSALLKAAGESPS